MSSHICQKVAAAYCVVFAFQSTVDIASRLWFLPMLHIYIVLFIMRFFEMWAHFHNKSSSYGFWRISVWLRFYGYVHLNLYHELMNFSCNVTFLLFAASVPLQSYSATMRYACAHNRPNSINCCTGTKWGLRNISFALVSYATLILSGRGLCSTDRAHWVER